MNLLKNLFGFGSLAGAAMALLLMLMSPPARPQATLSLNLSAADITAAQPWCQFYLPTVGTPSNAQLKQCAIMLMTRTVQGFSVSTQGAAVTAVPFNPN